MQKPTERKPFRPNFSNPPTQKTSTSSFSPAAPGTEVGAFAKASEKYMANNFSKGLDIPVKPITITHITCGSDDVDWQEPITPRPKIVKNKRGINRFVKPFPPQTPAMPKNASASTSERYTQVRGSTVTLPSLVQSPDKETVAPILKAASIVSPQNDNVNVSTSPPVSQVPVTIKMNVEQQADETTSVSSPLQGTSKLGLALYALPKKDFSFKLENGKMVPIHKNVLAVQSSHFYQQFYKSNDGSDSENVYGFDEEAVTLMVKACYQQHFDESILEENVCEQLVKLAAKYNIQCVMNLLPRYLSKQITEENVCSIAVRACETNDSTLRQKCATFIADFLTQLPGIENLPIEFIQEIIRAISAKNKK